MSIKLNAKYTEDFVSKSDLESIAPEIKKAHKTLTEKSGAGNDFLGWVDLPGRIMIKRNLKDKKSSRKNTFGLAGSYCYRYRRKLSRQQERLLNFVNHRITIWYAKIRRRYSSPETV